MSLLLTGTENAKQYRAKIKRLRKLEEQIDQAIEARALELARIQASKFALKSKATYKPTAEALEYQIEHWAEISSQPRPIHGGPAGLRRATLEAAQWDQTHRRGKVHAQQGSQGQAA